LNLFGIFGEKIQEKGENIGTSMNERFILVNVKENEVIQNIDLYDKGTYISCP
jgi:hypothetical protein